MATKLGPERLNELRQALVAKRRQLEDEVGRSVAYEKGLDDDTTKDLGDQANTAYTREFQFELGNGDRRLLREVADRAAQARRGRLRRVRALRGADRREAPRGAPVRALLHRVPAAPRARGQGRRRLEPGSREASRWPSRSAAGSIPFLISSFPPSARSVSTGRTSPLSAPSAGPAGGRFRSGSARAVRSAASPFRASAERCPCDACRRAPPPYAFARAVAEYRDGMREAIHALKFGSRPVLATPLGRLLAEAGARTLPVPPADWAEGLVPVPLHPARLAERGFNQAELLAAPCGARWRLPVLSRALIRARATLPQTDLDPAARRLNVRDAFRVPRPPRSVRPAASPRGRRPHHGGDRRRGRPRPPRPRAPQPSAS